jgi:predicted CopG family antitoxin
MCVMAKEDEPTTVRVYGDTHQQLKEHKVHPRESFDAVIRKLLESDGSDATNDNH